MFGEVTEEKLVGTAFLPLPPFWIGLRSFVIQTFPAHKKEISRKCLITIAKEIWKKILYLQFFINLLTNL